MVNRLGFSIAQIDDRDPISVAIQGLTAAKRWGDSTFVNLPLFFPGGSAVTVSVTPTANGLIVSDQGFAFREAEAIGAERSFARITAVAVERHNVFRDKRKIFVEVERSELSRAIADVAMASWSVVDKIYADREEDDDEHTLEDELTQKLVSMFGTERVKIRDKVFGASATEWGVSAIVSGSRQRSIFQAVGNNPVSVYRANTAFHDLASLEQPPALIAVVRRAAELGSKLGLLTQAAKVIEEDQPDSVFRKMAG